LIPELALFAPATEKASNVRHGLAMHDGKLISCDAGIHPGWSTFDSPDGGYIFQIDLA
jgi:hypothetical protein